MLLRFDTRTLQLKIEVKFRTFDPLHAYNYLSFFGSLLAQIPWSEIQR